MVVFLRGSNCDVGVDVWICVLAVSGSLLGSLLLSMSAVRCGIVLLYVGFKISAYVRGFVCVGASFGVVDTSPIQSIRGNAC